MSVGTRAPASAESEILHTLEIGRAPLWVFEHIEDQAEAWGGRFDIKAGKLELPVHAGLRQGFVVAEVEALANREGSKVRVKVLESDTYLDRVATFSLMIGALASFATLSVPFFPRLWNLLPPSLLIALASWLFIVARLRSSSLEDFLRQLERAAADPDDDDA